MLANMNHTHQAIGIYYTKEGFMSENFFPFIVVGGFAVVLVSVVISHRDERADERANV
jgi:hypothetical protein